MYLLGIDVGSSSIKLSLFDAEKGSSISNVIFPPEEMQILSEHKDWAEQDPESWMDNLHHAMLILQQDHAKKLQAVEAIGITYQMHGLVMVDRDGHLLRNSIIWCDSRAAATGNEAFRALGKEYCLSHLLNSPGNFTASKLRWVQQHEPDIYEKTYKFMLPGDYIAYLLTGEISTTLSGLSEGIFWDYLENNISGRLLSHYNIDSTLIPDIVDTFSIQGYLSDDMATAFGLKKGIPVTYRAGDQPNNAFSLNILEPGEVAATAGTSGVVYGVTDREDFDPLSRVNTFIHVNHSPGKPRYGVLLCLNSTGITNAWARQQLVGGDLSYDSMNALAAEAPVGSDGLMVFPFGNGAERILQNKNPGASISGLNFNIHNKRHLYRALQEGIIFALFYGMEIMKSTGVDAREIRAGHANMFLSPLFSQTLADISRAKIELFDTNGAEGAARAAGIGLGFYRNSEEAFRNLKKLHTIEPQTNQKLKDTYEVWKYKLDKIISH